MEQKRAILGGLGSNLALKDKKLVVELKYPLPEIEKMIEIAPAIKTGFEPKIFGSTKKKFPSFQTRIPALLAASS